MAEEKSKEVKETPSPVLPVSKKNEPTVVVTVTKFGAGQVSTGEHVAGEGDIYAERGAKLTVAKSVADRLETLGFAEAD